MAALANVLDLDLVYQPHHACILAGDALKTWEFAMPGATTSLHLFALSQIKEDINGNDWRVYAVPDLVHGGPSAQGRVLLPVAHVTPTDSGVTSPTWVVALFARYELTIFADMGETVQYMTLVVAEGQVAREVIMLRGEDANENKQIARALVFTMAKAMANGIIVRNLTILRVRQEQDSEGRNMGRHWVGMARHVKPANGDVATLGPRLIDGDPSYGINLSAGGFHTLAYLFERKSHEARHPALQASPIFTFVTVEPLPTVPPEFHH